MVTGDGRIAGYGDTEAFARASMVFGNVISLDKDSEFTEPGYSGTAGGVKLGGRARWTAGRLTTIATAWASFGLAAFAENTGNDFADRPDAFDDLVGLPDPYAIRDELAVGGALDIALRIGCTFSQLEVGTALVRDERSGIVVDDLMVAAAFGGYVNARMTFAFELRLVQEPTGALASGATLHHIGIAIGNIQQTRRFRAGIGAGLLLGFEVARQF